MQKKAAKSVVIGHGENALDRRERLLEEKRKRDTEKKFMADWLNEGKENPVVFVR